MADIRTTTTNYVHSRDPNLLNVHKAMVYRDDEPHLRVTLGSDNITITGDVNLVDTVTVNSTPEDPVHTHITEVGTSGILAVPYLPIGGTVELGTSTLAALESVSVQNTVTVTVNNFPTTSTVFQGTTPWVTTITNWPALQYVNGVLYAVQSGTWSVGVTGSVSVNNSVTITNTSFAITNFPTTSTVYQGTDPWNITGTIVASNFTSTVNVANTVTVNQGTNPWTVTGNINATIDGEVSIAGANPDAFGRARVSELFTLGDYKHIYALDPNFLDSTSTGGTVTFYPDQACARLATSSSTSSYAIHQTKFYHHYQPGKSQLIYDSVNFYAPHRNVTKRLSLIHI